MKTRAERLKLHTQLEALQAKEGQYNLIGKLAGVLAVVARGSRHPRDVLPPRGFIRVHRGGASRAVNAAPRYGDATNRRRARRS